ncbi:hypothetical protein MMYC01_210028 [Madurella mycetomatis]|uniref:Heterokaryon incompatibility domain-containing protein n=1 Tax=Madurella mycetomatis TaxID=100816 RepID=A0A175VPP0_9PEZI|nr:hypothetical protein MMYC01_210028 [Madurella mycetomatis]
MDFPPASLCRFCNGLLPGDNLEQTAMQARNPPHLNHQQNKRNGQCLFHYNINQLRRCAGRRRCVLCLLMAREVVHKLGFGCVERCGQSELLLSVDWERASVKSGTGVVQTYIMLEIHPVRRDGAPSCTNEGSFYAGFEVTTCNLRGREYDLPKRLIDVGPKDGSRPPRLVLTQDLVEKDKNALRYATLSHCWGGMVPLRTIKATEAAFRYEIPLNAVPATFLDAGYICRNLGVSYLWIDAVCIVQDDQAEWEEEAAKMGDIYSGSVLTIAASHAPNSHGGQVEEWESGAEIPELGLAKKTLLAGTAVDDSESWRETWRTWVTAYSKRLFTVPSDRLPALAGVMGRFEAETGMTPLLGLWAESISHDLLWRRNPKFKVVCSSRLLRNLPSWSWLSCNTAVTYEYAKANKFLEYNHTWPTHEYVSLLEGHIEWVGNPMTSSISSATLVLHGPAVEMYLRYTEKGVGGSMYSHTNYILYSLTRSGYQQLHAHVQFDDGNGRRSGCYTFLLLRKREDPGNSWMPLHHYFALVLEDSGHRRKVTQGENVVLYRRVGIVNFRGCQMDWPTESRDLWLI